MQDCSVGEDTCHQGPLPEFNPCQPHGRRKEPLTGHMLVGCMHTCITEREHKGTNKQININK